MSTTILAVHVDAIPAAMRAERRWVCWRLVRRRNRPTKVPVNPYTGCNASSTEPTDWGTLDVALACMDQEDLPGIGFMLGDGWAGVDHDHCFDPATGTLETWAWDNVCLLDSYTEVSPRGEGVKTIVRGTLPPGRRRTGRVEMYDSGRLFATTGDAQWTPWTCLDEAAPVLLLGTGMGDEELGSSLLHLRELGLMRLARDAHGALYYRVRTDDAARLAALLDDHGRGRRN
jgi:primase-polymerase (primpol)-like protein